MTPRALRPDVVAPPPAPELLLMLLAAGVFLAAHFGTWMVSLAYTTVASAIAMTATQPVWAALLASPLLASPLLASPLLASLRGQRLPPVAWLGIAVAVGGVFMVTGIDLTVSVAALGADLLALAGGVFGAAYLTASGEVRGEVSTPSYTLVCYGTAAAVLLVACLASGQRLSGFDSTTWLMIAAIAAGPQLLGHSLFNRLLRTTSPTVVSLAALFVTPGAALIAWGWLGQEPPPAIVPAIALVLGGLVLVVTSRPTPAR